MGEKKFIGIRGLLHEKKLFFEEINHIVLRHNYGVLVNIINKDYF